MTKVLEAFESWDETYVHTSTTTANRIVLEVRDEGDAGREPWTWVRTQGKGRVFYTAWGHDERTWAHAGLSEPRRARHPLGLRRRSAASVPDIRRRRRR